jgi:hypothetical protein
MPPYAIRLSTRCRFSISFKTEFDRPTVFRTSRAFLCALCNQVQGDVTSTTIRQAHSFTMPTKASRVLCKLNCFVYLQTIPLVRVLVEDGHSCLKGFVKHSRGATGRLHCLGFVVKYLKDM